MGIEIIVGIASLAVSAVSAVAQNREQRKNREAQQRAAETQAAADKEAQAISSAQEGARNAATRRQKVREERVRRARIQQAAQNQGASGSSGAATAGSAGQLHLGSQISDIAGQEKAARGITAQNQRAADAVASVPRGSSGNAAAIGNFAGTVFGLAAGTSGFQSDFDNLFK